MLMESLQEGNGHLMLRTERNTQKKKVPPQVKLPNSDEYYEEAKSYVNKFFIDHLVYFPTPPLPYIF